MKGRRDAMDRSDCPPLVQLPSPLFVLGAAYSGKSELAIQAFHPEPSTSVIGTAALSELEARIHQLKSLRPSHWQHLEGFELNEILTEALRDSRQVLIDSINQWLANVLLSSWNKYDLDQQESRLNLEIRAFCEVMRSKTDHRIVIVSSEIGAGLSPPQELARFFRRMLGHFHRAIAADSAAVVQVVAGIPMLVKMAKVRE